MVDGPPPDIASRLESLGIKGGTDGRTWRFVTHHGIGPEDIDQALDIVDSVFREYAP